MSISKVKIGSTEHDLVASSLTDTSTEKVKLNNTNIAYGTCSTAAATAAKVITISGNTNWTLAAGSVIVVKFTYTNTASNPKFNVNGTGAKSVLYDTSVITTYNLSYAGYKDRYGEYMYDGSQYVFIGWSIDTTYSAMTGATAYADGKAGLVPAPGAGDNGLYLRGDGTWATPTNTTYNTATTTTAGLMSAADKTKLDGIGDVATTSAKGLMSAADKSKLNLIAEKATYVDVSRSLYTGHKIATVTVKGWNDSSTGYTGTYELYAPTLKVTDDGAGNVTIELG